MNGIESKINSINRKVDLLLNFDDISRRGAREIKESLCEMQNLVNKKLPIQNVSNRRELLLDFSHKLRGLLNFVHQQPLDKYVDYYEEGKL